MIDFSEINQNEKYKVISINYEKENGIKFYENLENFKKEFDNKFYKIYIFNENRMYEYINNDDEIIKRYVSNEEAFEKYDRYIYIDLLENKYNKVKVTYIVNKNNKKDFYFSGVVV